MSQFITGVLIANDEGATYEGVVYDRFLQVQLASGEVLPLFDPFRPISTGLPVGERYEFILASLPAPGTICTDERSFSLNRKEIWCGSIIEIGWEGGNKRYRRVRPGDFEQERWLLLETDRGYLLMRSSELAFPAPIGTNLWWENIRLDLRAVV